MDYINTSIASQHNATGKIIFEEGKFESNNAKLTAVYKCVSAARAAEIRDRLARLAALLARKTADELMAQIKDACPYEYRACVQSPNCIQIVDFGLLSKNLPTQSNSSQPALVTELARCIEGPTEGELLTLMAELCPSEYRDCRSVTGCEDELMTSLKKDKDARPDKPSWNLKMLLKCWTEQGPKWGGIQQIQSKCT